MRIPGERVKGTRLVRGGRYVAAVEVEMVIPPDDPSEPCYESETVQLVREVAEHAERGDRNWLEQHGQVYELIGSGHRPTPAKTAQAQERYLAPFPSLGAGTVPGTFSVFGTFFVFRHLFRLWECKTIGRQPVWTSKETVLGKCQ